MMDVRFSANQKSAAVLEQEHFCGSWGKAKACIKIDRKPTGKRKACVKTDKEKR